MPQICRRTVPSMARGIRSKLLGAGCVRKMYKILYKFIVKCPLSSPAFCAIVSLSFLGAVMKENTHVQAIPENVLTSAQTKIQEVLTLLAPYMLALTPAER